MENPSITPGGAYGACRPKANDIFFAWRFLQMKRTHEIPVICFMKVKKYSTRAQISRDLSALRFSSSNRELVSQLAMEVDQRLLYLLCIIKFIHIKASELSFTSMFLITRVREVF